MFTCKQVSKALSESDYQDLSLFKKLMLKLHVTLCLICGKFNRQVMESQDMCRHYKKHEHILESSRPKMDNDKKQELKELLATESKSLSRQANLAPEKVSQSNHL